MRPAYTKELEERISALPFGEAFTAFDFTNIANAGTINRALSRLADEGTIRRIVQGVYDRPEYSEFLQEYAAPQMDRVAHALARRFNWTIAPAEDTALNLLHLSTQVPATWMYVSDGPYRSYIYNQTELVFKHKATREIKNLNDKTLLLIQALRGLGKDRITDQDIRILQRSFADEDKATIMRETQSAPSWIHAEAARIFAEEGEEK